MIKLYRGIMKKIKILKPTIGGHDGSSLRELIDMWGDMGLCEVVHNNKIKKHSYQHDSLCPEARPWVGSVGKIMLYDNPILDKLHDGLSWEMALWANQVHNGPNSYPWIFWPKHSKIHAKVVSKGIKSYDDRRNISVFIGSQTTRNRSLSISGLSWQDSIQHFWMGNPNARLYAPEQYLDVLADHKFGLCLPGVGPKCLRDVELMGLGTVPIFVPGVSTNYYEKLVEDKHYLFARTPQEVKYLIDTCSKEKWEYLSNNCQEWFDRNCSPLGSFKTTLNIIEQNYEGVL